jgi:HEAT repeat protein
LAQTLSDPREPELVRWRAAQALGLIGDAGGAGALAEALMGKPLVRSAAARALRSIGDATSLPMKVLAASGVPAARRAGILEALGRVRPQDGIALRYRVAPVAAYCQSVLSREDVGREVREGAACVLAYLDGQQLVRPAEEGPPTLAAEMLRPASASQRSAPSAQLVRVAEAPADRAPETREA